MLITVHEKDQTGVPFRLLRIMSVCRPNLFSIADVIAIPTFVAWFIWRGQFVAPATLLLAAGWMAASFVIHGDTLRTLGVRVGNLWPATVQAAIVYGVFAFGLFLIGLALGERLYAPPNYRSFDRLGIYFGFCVVQQITLNSLLTNRLLLLLKHRWAASLLAGAIFSALHWPNLVLVPLTFIAGTAMAAMFARVRNIFPLAAGQALLGSLVWWAFPLAWHHMLRVGPGYHNLP